MSLANRQRTNLTFDKVFWEWLNQQSKRTGTPVSRILEVAAMEKYDKEFTVFLKAKEGESK